MTRGTFIWRDSFWHRTDPRAKILFSVLLSISTLMMDSVLPLVGTGLFTVILSFLSVGCGETRMNVKRILPLFLCILLFMPIYERQHDALVSIGTFKLITREGMEFSLRTAMKFLSISMIFSLLLETERMEYIISALLWFRLPYGAALTLSVALTFVPELMGRYYEIKDAMSLRITDQNTRQGMFPVLVSVIVSAVRQIPETASALEEKGLRKGKHTQYRVLSMTPLIFPEIVLSVIIPVTLMIVFGG